MGLRLLGVPQGGRVLLPAYVCKSVVAAVLAHAATPVFYPVSPELAPDVAAVESLLRRHGRDLLLVVHYFGFPPPTWNDLHHLAEVHGLPILEDCAHALYSQPNGRLLGSWGDASIFSLTKSLPVPEGGVLVLRRAGADIAARPSQWKWKELPSVSYSLKNRLGLTLRPGFLARKRAWARTYLEDDGTPLAADGCIGRLSLSIAQQVDAQEVVAKRRRNFLYLLDSFESFQPWASPLFKELPEGVCPLGFPVLVQDRDALYRSLLQQGVGARVLWDPLPQAIPLEKFPTSLYLRDHILALPVHQDLGRRHLDRMVDVLRTIWPRPLQPQRQP